MPIAILRFVRRVRRGERTLIGVDAEGLELGADLAEAYDGGPHHFGASVGNLLAELLIRAVGEGRARRLGPVVLRAMRERLGVGRLAPARRSRWCPDPDVAAYLRELAVESDLVAALGPAQAERAAPAVVAAMRSAQNLGRVNLEAP